MWDSPQVHRCFLLYRGPHAGTDSSDADTSETIQTEQERVVPPAGPRFLVHSYRFLVEVGLLKHHGLGLAESVSRTLWIFCTQLNVATLWSHNGGQLLC